MCVWGGGGGGEYGEPGDGRWSIAYIVKTSIAVGVRETHVPGPTSVFIFTQFSGKLATIA